MAEPPISKKGLPPASMRVLQAFVERVSKEPPKAPGPLPRRVDLTPRMGSPNTLFELRTAPGSTPRKP